MSGDDLSCMDFFCLGGHGAISAAANILAHEFVRFFKDSKGQLKEFERHKDFFKGAFQGNKSCGCKTDLK